MNLKNHTTPRFWQLTGDRGDAPAFAHATTYKFNLSNIPFATRRMCNYLAGIVVTVLRATFTYVQPGETDPEFLDQSDILRALFESAEVQQTMFGTPVSANHYLGKYFGLFEYIGNGMQPLTSPQPIGGGTQSGVGMPINFFIPLSALLGMKGHHTAQPVCCYDRAQLILRTAASGVISGLTGSFGSSSIRVSAVVVPEPELRLGPGTSFMQYTQVASANGTIITVDGLGNSTTLEGAEPGAGIASMLWMGDGVRKFGGAQSVASLEYVAAPFRDLQQTRHLDPLVIDWMQACGMLEVSWNQGANQVVAGDLSGGGARAGYLYPVSYPQSGDYTNVLEGAEFLPLIVPRKFLETSKLQVIQGSQTVGLKHANSFSGQHIFTVLQYHSWTPAKQEEVLRKLIDSGVAMTVWGTNALVPKTKIVNKQPAGSLNPSKTRFFATTWEPEQVVSTPPTA